VHRAFLVPGHRRRGGRYAAVVVSVVMVMLAGGTAAASGGTVAGSGGGGSAGPLPGAAAGHYTNAPCNRAVNKTSKASWRVFARCFSVVHTGTDHRIVANPNDPPAGSLGPADIQSAYDLPDAGQGQTVAVVDAFGYSSAEADLAQFRSFYGLLPCTSGNGCFTKVDQNGGTNYPPDDSGWALETALDLDAVSSACPNCHILLVEGNDSGLDSLGAAVNTAVALGAKYVSNSYGVPGEDPSETQYDAYYNHPGVAVTVSTGDFGWDNNIQGGTSPSWPADNPNVVSVGGTTLTKDSSVARGWIETAWNGAGSGCSQIEPHPDYQTGIDTACPNNRASADISADADPNTGLGIYDTLGNNGWLRVGGTSLSSPLIAAMYALAGTPVPNTYPVSYPYDPTKTSDLNDVTQGSNGSCGNVLCNAGAGWDGPTGLGTPNGVQVLLGAPHGLIAGQITDTGTGTPLAGATVSTPEGYKATTDSTGHYDLSIPVGSYDLTAQAFGYASKTQTGVSVTEAQTSTLDFALTSVPSHTLSGTITDGSGHGWPLYAKITIDGYPHGAIYTDPYTGHYTVDLPDQNTYTLHATPQYPGYQTSTFTATINTSNTTQDAQATINPTTCTAPGYALTIKGTYADFEGWSGTTPQDGWTITDNINSGHTWEFDDPASLGNQTGGSGTFATASPYAYGGTSEDTSLVSPVLDLSTVEKPAITLDTWFASGGGTGTAEIDLSLDGGQTWQNESSLSINDNNQHPDIPIPAAASQSNVRVRFHLRAAGIIVWQIDNVLIGERQCKPATGGLLAGAVTDNNTGAPANGATVASDTNPGEFGVSFATPDDPNLPDGFYWLFSSLTGAQSFTATDAKKYTPATNTVTVAPDAVTRQDWRLQTGHLTVTPTAASVTETLGQSKTTTLTYTNDGTEPVHVTMHQYSAGFTPMDSGTTVGASGIPLEEIKINRNVALGGLALQQQARTGPPVQSDTSAPTAPPWSSIADYPSAIGDNAVAYNAGKVYSVGGWDGSSVVANGYVYDPSAQQWSRIADAPQALEAPAGGFVDGKLILVGGWDKSGTTVSSVSAYDPSRNTWSPLASLPTPVAGATSAVLDGQLYIIGGCSFANYNGCLPLSSSVYRYQAGNDSWTRLADYPVGVAFTACAGVASEIVCAGGTDPATETGTKSTYVYNPGTDSWAKAADLPYHADGMASAGANAKLQVVGGINWDTHTITNQSSEYDPAKNAWSVLPNANNAEWRGGGSCGLYQIGGVGGTGGTVNAASQLLAGYDQCAGNPVPWLSESPTQFDVGPGKSVIVTVAMNSAAVAQPGDYTATLAVDTDTPYPVQQIQLTMHLNPPKTWGRISGTVTDASHGTPISGATIQIGTNGGKGQTSFTLSTNNSGYYQLWLDAKNSPLQVIAFADGYVPQTKTVKIGRGSKTKLNFALTTT
jgi:N-acetylneuraminic acid mutarotase